MNTILLIDDNRDMLATLAYVLRRDGLHVVTASDGVEGLASFDAFNPDLIVSDIDMPRLDGFGVLRGVRSQLEKPRVPFLFLSGRSDSETLQLAQEEGADGFLQKPISSSDLIEAIRNELDNACVGVR